MDNQHDYLPAANDSDTLNPRQPDVQPPIPKPVFLRLLFLFGGGIGCLFIGANVAWVMGDIIALAMSAIIGAALITAGLLLRRKISKGEIYAISGVCTSSIPKMFGRYSRTTFVVVETGEEVAIVLPKKTGFRVCDFKIQESLKMK